jgi:arylsulfatase A-like enzyme
MAAPAFAPRARASARRKPNIVWIMGDDLGWGDLGCYGQKWIRTPNVDRMAREGTRFTDAYSGCTVCAPSRSVLMTGLHMGHTPIRSNPGGVPLLASEVTVAEALSKAGYISGCFGKWGLGDIGTDGVPWKHGFEEFYGYLHQVHAHWHYPRFLYNNDKESPLPGNENLKRTTYSHDAIAEKALSFIRRAKDKPFFCYVPFTLPHWELLVPEDSLAEYRGKIPEAGPYTTASKHYADQEFPRAAYAGMVSRMDRDAGRILALLEELRLSQDTIVFFTSDNGSAERLRKDEFFVKDAPFRGNKQNFYEGGIRTPMVVRWPGRVKAGAVSRFPWYFADFFATACELAGASTPHGLDGMPVVRTLLGEKQRPHEFMYWELPRYDGASGTFRNEAPMAAARMGKWKAVRPKPDAAIELYDLSKDIGETRDLAAVEPGVARRMESRMNASRVEPRVQKQPAPMWGFGPQPA